MTLSRKIPLPESRLADRAPPARFKSGRRAPGVIGRSRTGRCRSIHGAHAPKVNCPLKRGRSKGALGSEAQDGERPAGARRARHRRLVPPEPSPAGGGAVGGAMPQAAGPLRLLRHHRQLPGAGPVPLVGRGAVAQVAGPAVARAIDLGPLRAPHQTLPSATAACRAERLPRSYTVA